MDKKAEIEIQALDSAQKFDQKTAGMVQNQNQQYNIKKEALGPNGKR